MRLGAVLCQIQEDRINGVMEYQWGIAVALLQVRESRKCCKLRTRKEEAKRG
jgi:hypothetical protein